MRKIIKISCVLFLVAILAVFLCSCLDGALMYGDKTKNVDNIEYFMHSFRKCCFAGAYTWTSDSNQATVTIPDTCDGYRVTSLGGFIGSGAPCPFMVLLPDVDSIYSKDTLPDEAQIEQYHLELNIGKNVEKLRLIMMEEYYGLGSNRFAQILVTVNCSEENPVFYSEDGKLYRKSDNSLVEGFFYASDYSLF